MTTVEEYLQKEIDAFQLDDDADDPARCARTILKHLQLSVLSSNKIEDGSKDDEGYNQDSVRQKMRVLLEPVLLQYIDGILAAQITTTDARETHGRLLDLLSILICSFDAEDSGDSVNEDRNPESLMTTVLDRVQLFTTASTDKLRSQACTLLGRIVFYIQRKQSKGPKDTNDDNRSVSHIDSLSRIESLLIPRLKDTHQTVRQSAIQAVGILLQPTTTIGSGGTFPNCDAQSHTKTFLPTTTFPSALEELLWSMWHDPSVANRVEAVLAVPIVCLDEEELDDEDDEDKDDEEDGYPRSTIDHIIARIRDVKEKVRVAAVQSLHDKVDPRWMNEIHFCDVIQHGLTERCRSTREATVALICAKWMKAAKFDPVELVRMMQPTLIEEECEMALKVVLDMARSDDRSLIKELSDPELRSFISSTQQSLIQLKDSSVEFDECQLFFTRVSCSTAKDSPDMTTAQKEALLAQASPDIPTLCDLFQKHLVRLVDSIEEEDGESEDQESFVCSQLLRLVKATGLQEEGSRRHFATVMSSVISSHQTPDNIADMCVEAMLSSDDIGFLDTFMQVIVSLENSPSEGKIRLLSIFTVVLENGPSNLSSHRLLSAMQKVVLQTLDDEKSSDEEREIATHCLGQLGLFSPESTVLGNYKAILLRIAASKKESLQSRGQAMLALADLSQLFPGMIEPLEQEDGSCLSLADLAATMLMHRNRIFCSLVAEVTCKLLFTGRLCDSSLLSRLLVLFFDPSKPSQDDESDLSEPGNPLRMQQLLSLFFPAFALKSEAERTALLGSVEGALEIALALSSRKTKKRPLVFPMAKMVEFISTVVDEAIEVAKKGKTQESTDQQPEALINPAATDLMVVLQVARFLTRNESSLTATQLRSLSKLVGNYEISPSEIDTPRIRAFKECLEELEEVMIDTTSLKYIRTVAKAMSKVKSNEDPDEYDTDEDVHSEEDKDIADVENSNVNQDDETVSEEEIECLGATLVKPTNLDKENSRRSSFASTNMKGLSTRSSRRSSTGSQLSSIPVLESIGSPNHM